MSRNLKAAAAGALALAMFVLQGCNLDPFALALFMVEWFTLIDTEMCVYQSMIDDLNSTATYKHYEGCLKRENGKVQNVTQCCADKVVTHSLVVSNSTCCTKEWADADIKNFSVKYNTSGDPEYDNATTNLTASYWDETLVQYCYNMTGSLDEELKNASTFDCAPGTDTIDEADMDMHLALFDSANVRSVHDKKASTAAKMMTKIAELRHSNNFGNMSVQPAVTSAAFFVGGAVVAVFAHGLVKHFRAQSETSSNYAQLLA